MELTLTANYPLETIQGWVRGLLTVAWADGDFAPQEQALIQSLTRETLGFDGLATLTIINPEELAQALGSNPRVTEDFLRTAVLVAVADGDYSTPEHDLLQRFCGALGQDALMLTTLRQSLTPDTTTIEDSMLHSSTLSVTGSLLKPVRTWLDNLEIQDTRLARLVCKLIPGQCPFERDINLFGRTVAHIPPLCKLNPLYDELVGVRFRALNYLAEAGEDISAFC